MCVAFNRARFPATWPRVFCELKIMKMVILIHQIIQENFAYGDFFMLIMIGYIFMFRMVKTRRFSNHVSRLLSQSHTFAIIVILDLKIHQSMRIHWPFFPKTWTKGHWLLGDLSPHVCWGHMCDSTQGSLCPSPMTIHQCMWIHWSILQNTTYIHIHTNILHTTYRMSDHIVSYWTQFRRDKNAKFRFRNSSWVNTPLKCQTISVAHGSKCYGWLLLYGLRYNVIE